MVSDAVVAQKKKKKRTLSIPNPYHAKCPHAAVIENQPSYNPVMIQARVNKGCNGYTNIRLIVGCKPDYLALQIAKACPRVDLVHAFAQGPYQNG